MGDWMFTWDCDPQRLALPPGVPYRGPVCGPEWDVAHPYGGGSPTEIVLGADWVFDSWLQGDADGMEWDVRYGVDDMEAGYGTPNDILWSEEVKLRLGQMVPSRSPYKPAVARFRLISHNLPEMMSETLVFERATRELYVRLPSIPGELQGSHGGGEYEEDEVQLRPFWYMESPKGGWRTATDYIGNVRAVMATLEEVGGQQYVTVMTLDRFMCGWSYLTGVVYKLKDFFGLKHIPRDAHERMMVWLDRWLESGEMTVEEPSEDGRDLVTWMEAMTGHLGGRV